MRSTARRGPLFLIVADKFALARQIRRRLIARATIGTQTGSYLPAFFICQSPRWNRINAGLPTV